MKSFSKIMAILALFIISCILALFSLNTISCTKTVTEVVYDTTVVHDTTQNIVFCMLYNRESKVCLYSDPIPAPDSVNATKEWDSNSTTFTVKYTCPGYVTLKDTTNNTVGEVYTVNVTSNLGETQGSIAVPGGLSITQPSDNDTLPIGNVTIKWTASQGADFYLFDFWMDAIDSLGSLIKITELDTFLNADSIIIPSSYFETNGASYYNVFLIVYPYAGQQPIPGVPGNMTGTLKGFITGIGYGSVVSFYVGTPISKTDVKQKKRELSHDDIRDAYLRALGVR